MRYLKIEFSKSREQWKELGPKFSSDEMGVIRACARKVDDLFNKQFETLEILSKGVFDAPFRKDDVHQMYILFERFRRETSEKLGFGVQAGAITLRGPQYWEVMGRNLDRGDSVVFIPLGCEITPNSIIHELVHAVYNSFCKEQGVNYNLRDYFNILEIVIRSFVKETKKFRKWLSERYKKEEIQKELFCHIVADLLEPPKKR